MFALNDNDDGPTNATELYICDRLATRPYKNPMIESPRDSWSLTKHRPAIATADGLILSPILKENTNINYRSFA